MVSWPFLSFTAALLLLVCLDSVTTRPSGASREHPGSWISPGQQQKHPLPNRGTQKQSEHSKTVKTVSTTKPFIDSSATPESHQDSSTTRESHQVSSTTPESHQDSSTTRESHKNSSTTPESHQDSSTTRESHQDSSTTRESHQDSSTTPESHQDSSTTRESHQDSSTTPESHQDSSTTPESHQDSSTTPESHQDSSTTPESHQDSSTTAESHQDSSTTSTLEFFTDSSTTTTPGPNTTPQTTVTTTLPAVPCVGENGEKLVLLQQVLYESTCRSCTCFELGLVCEHVHCPPPVCVDYIRPAGSCCSECPNGINCRIWETGEIISSPVMRNGGLCECSVEIPLPDFLTGEGRIATCRPLNTTTHETTSTTTTVTTTTTTAPGFCLGDYGEPLPMGKQVLYPGLLACKVCVCLTGGLSCYFRDCIVPMCVDSVRPQGGCCYYCPNGTNCRIEGTAEIIWTQVERDGMLCDCPQRSSGFPSFLFEGGPTADCTPLLNTNTNLTSVTTPETTTSMTLQP